MNKVYIEKSMRECLFEAFKNNAIISSDGLSDIEFIFVCGGKAYYEDGGCLGCFSEALSLLESQEWTSRYKWYIIGYLTENDIKEVKGMIKNPRVWESAWFEKEIKRILGLPYNTDRV